VELRIDLEDAAIPLQLDKDSIHQVFDNLISNAMKFIGKGAVTIGAKIDGSFVRVFVKDAGPGIAPENLGRLFKPFGKLASPDGKHHEGTGLGLVISKQIIEQHGGRIRAEPRPGEGAVFYFTLPLHL
jgi:signal transduction histidine kinase